MSYVIKALRTIEGESLGITLDDGSTQVLNFVDGVAITNSDVLAQYIKTHLFKMLRVKTVDPEPVVDQVAEPIIESAVSAVSAVDVVASEPVVESENVLDTTVEEHPKEVKAVISGFKNKYLKKKQR
jgi:hypothetical protein